MLCVFSLRRTFLAASILLGAWASADTVTLNSISELQGAIDSASEPRTIILPSGEFPVTAGIRMKSYITIRGNNTRLIFSTTSNFPAFSAEGTITPYGTTVNQPSWNSTWLATGDSSGLKVGDLIHVDYGNGIDGHTNVIEQIIDTNYVRMRFPRPPGLQQGQGIFKVNPVEEVSLENLTIVGAQNAFFGKYLRAMNFKDVTATRARFNTVFWHTIDSVAQQSLVDDCGGGITFIGSSGASVVGNTILNHRMSGVLIRSCSGVLVNKNLVAGNPTTLGQGINGDGITVSGSRGTMVTNNDIRYPESYGLWLKNSMESVASMNSAVGCGSSAYFLQGGVDDQLDRSWAYNSETGFGVSVVGAVRPRLTSNILENVQRGVYIAETSNASTFQNISRQNRQADVSIANSNMQAN